MRFLEGQATFGRLGQQGVEKMSIRGPSPSFFYERNTCHMHFSPVGLSPSGGWYRRKGAGSATRICPRILQKGFAVHAYPASCIWARASAGNAGGFSAAVRRPDLYVVHVSGDRHHGTRPDLWSAMARKCVACCSG